MRTIQDMLKKGSNYCIFLLTSLILSSCGNEIRPCDNYVKRHFSSYSNVYQVINDSIKLFLDSTLGSVGFIYQEAWQVDSMVCIDLKEQKIYFALINSSGTGKGCTADVIGEFLGKKINGIWYFFRGGDNLIIPRDIYGKDEMHPLSFHELSQIARKEMLESALFKKDGEYVVSDKWIDDHFYQNGYGKYDTRAQYDSIHWMLITRKWKEKIDTNEYKPVKKEAKANS